MDVSSICTLSARDMMKLMFLSEEGPKLEMLNVTIHIGSTSTFLYFDLYLNTAYADTMFISLFIHWLCAKHIWPQSSSKLPMGVATHNPPPINPPRINPTYSRNINNYFYNYSNSVLVEFATL